MASTSETGHAKNAASLDQLISVISAYGTIYNPSKSGLKLTALQTLSSLAKTALSNVNTAESAESNAIAARKIAFSSIDKLVTRVQNAVIATDTTTQVDETVKSIVRKIKGERASAKLSEADKATLVAEGKTSKQISSAQTSFDSRIENFDKLIKLLTSITLYTPNENELKLTTLTTIYNDLKAKNAAVMNASTALSNARIVRNDIFYKANTGLVDIALDAKTYIKSIFGASSPQYKQATAIKFKTIKI